MQYLHFVLFKEVYIGWNVTVHECLHL